MRNKVIIILSVAIILITAIVIILNVKNDNSASKDLADDIKEIPIGIYEEDNTIIDSEGNDVTNNPDDYNSIYDYKIGCKFRPTEKWYTESSYAPENEIEMATLLESEIKGYVKYSSELLTEGDEYLYNPISSQYGTTDLLFHIQTKDAEYVACRISDTVYYYNIADNIVHSVPVIN